MVIQNILLNIDEIILYSRIICQGNPDKAKLSSALRANYALMHNLGLMDEHFA